jgi:hypothetical protein
VSRDVRWLGKEGQGGGGALGRVVNSEPHSVVAWRDAGCKQIGPDDFSERCSRACKKSGGQQQQMHGDQRH